MSFPLNQTNLFKGDVCINEEAADCLSCSGCITVDETIQINQNTPTEILKNLCLNTFFCVASISRTTIRAFQTMEETYFETFKKIKEKLLFIGFKKVFEMDSAQTFYSVECAKEFLKNKTKSLFTSQCTGFVCYIEQKYPELVPFLCKIKSKEQILGSYIKKTFSSLCSEDKIYHVCFVPCYDKKIEAIKKGNKMQSIDNVLTTRELSSLISLDLSLEKNLSLFELEPEPPSPLECVFYLVQKELYPKKKLKTVQKYLHGETVYSIEDTNGAIIMTFAEVSTFSTIQKILRSWNNKKKHNFIDFKLCQTKCHSTKAENESLLRTDIKEKIEKDCSIFKEFVLNNKIEREYKQFKKKVLEW